MVAVTRTLSSRPKRRPLASLLLLVTLAAGLAACNRGTSAPDPGANGNVYDVSYVGVNLADPTRFLLKYYGLPEQQGILVLGVLPGSPADKAGLKEGTLITAIGKDPVRQTFFFQRNLLNRDVGSVVQLSVIDPNQSAPHTLRLTTAARPVELEGLFAKATNDQLSKNQDDPIALVVQAMDLETAALQAVSNNNQDQANQSFLQAYKNYSRAIELKSDFDMAYYRRGKLLTTISTQASNLDAALPDQNKAISLDPNLAAAYGERARLYAVRQQAGDLEAGVQDAKKALALDPSDQSPLRTLGSLYAEMGKSPEAMSAYYRYLAFPNSQSDAFAVRGLIAQLNAKYLGAKPQAQQ